MAQGKIILTGYRATGKSSVGALLAARLGLDFVDMDKVIETRQDCSIQQMVAAHGWEFFRDQERRLLIELTKKRGLVIATGGGAVLQQDLWPRFMENSLCVWLTADRRTICRRLAKDAATEHQRPPLAGKDVYQEIDRVLSEREPLYRRGAHLVIDTAGQTPEEIVATILKAYESQC